MGGKKGKKWLLVFLFIPMLLGMALFLLYFSDLYASKTYYRDFGIYMPDNYSVHGIDVSHHQSRINWQLVSNMRSDDLRIRFAFIKATEGSFMVDSHFMRNWKQSKNKGIVRGAYHFFDPDADPENQALLFTQSVRLGKGDLPPVLDVETSHGVSDAQLRRNVRHWLSLVENHYHVRPIIYTYSDFYRDHLAGDFESYPLWIAHYTGRQLPRIRRDWHFWQHHETGHVSGIDGNVDFNVFNGSESDFKKILMR